MGADAGSDVEVLQQAFTDGQCLAAVVLVENTAVWQERGRSSSSCVDGCIGCIGQWSALVNGDVVALAGENS